MADKSIGERVEVWQCDGMPKDGLTPTEREEVIADALGSFLAEHVGKTEEELRSLGDAQLVSTHYWAMHEALR